MRTLTRRLLIAFILATLGGTLLHFVYDWLPNPLTALISPVRESIWEHLKIIFWPYLAAMLLLTRGGGRGAHAPWLASLLVICAAMLGAGWLYHIRFGGEGMFFDIALYVVLMGAGFLLPRLFHSLSGKPVWRVALWVLTLLLGCAILFFTFRPPSALIFADLSAARTWVTIPY